MHVEIVEMFPGGGTLLAAFTAGLARAGISFSVVGLFELEEQYLAVAAAAHPDASTWSGSVGHWHPAEFSIPRRGPRIFLAGIPCTGASRAGISKNGLKCAEEHKDAGYLFLPTIHYLRLHRPEIVVFENTDSYRDTASANWLRDALTVSGYTFDERIVNPLKEFGAPTQRKRWILAASRIGVFTWMYEANAFSGTLASFLDPVSEKDDTESATSLQVEADSRYTSRKAAEGCGFAMTLIDHASTRCPTIPKSYGKRQPTGTFVRTTRSYRMVRPHEVGRIHMFERDLFAGLPKTLQYELWGQGVVATPFICLGECVGRFMRAQLGAESSLQTNAVPTVAGYSTLSQENAVQLELFAC